MGINCCKLSEKFFRNAVNMKRVQKASRIAKLNSNAVFFKKKPAFWSREKSMKNICILIVV